MTNLDYSYLRDQHKVFIDKLSLKMRQQHTGVALTATIPQANQSTDDGTLVEWVTENSRGPCAPTIRFKVLLF